MNIQAQKAYIRGKKDKKLGKALSENPFLMFEMAYSSWWEKGWMDEEEQAYQKKIKKLEKELKKADARLKHFMRSEPKTMKTLREEKENIMEALYDIDDYETDNNTGEWATPIQVIVRKKLKEVQ